jgi:hypothetical protein
MMEEHLSLQGGLPEHGSWPANDTKYSFLQNIVVFTSATILE